MKTLDTLPIETVLKFPRKALIGAIARKSMLKCPSIVPSKVFVRESDGYEYSSGGSAPWPSRVERRGYVYTDGRITFGKRHGSISEAREAWKKVQRKKAAGFARVLRSMPNDELMSQARFWFNV